MTADTDYLRLLGKARFTRQDASKSNGVERFWETCSGSRRKHHQLMKSED
ncbi:hypothetical protein [Bradyrhizobium sp.]|nr:hypothetical protein [Bradyrhizobium sp.]